MEQFCTVKTKGGKQAGGVEGKATVKCRKGSIDKGGSLNSAILHDELLQAA